MAQIAQQCQACHQVWQAPENCPQQTLLPQTLLNDFSIEGLVSFCGWFF
jgi:hypothetical protein